jgi:type III restriction enzyme
MYFGTDTPETVSVMGTPAFMEFVESIQSEGVTFERRPMGAGTTREDSLMVEVDTENGEKNLDALDIPLPKLSRKYQREFKNLEELQPSAFGNPLLPVKPFTDEETREIVFKQMIDAKVHHTLTLDGTGVADYRSVVGFFARQLLKDLRLVGGYDILYPKVRDFMRDYLFNPSPPGPVNLEDPVILRNLSEPEAGKILYDSFKVAINALTVGESGSTRIEGRIRLRDTRPFRTEHRQWLPAKKSLFTKIVGEPHSGGFELRFASFLEASPDVQAFAKNYLAVGFKLDYVKAGGDLANYTPDFILRDTGGIVWIVETKGREEIDLPQKMTRLRQWCEDATSAEAAEGVTQRYDFLFVDQTGFEKHAPKTLESLSASFTEYKS